MGKKRQSTQDMEDEDEEFDSATEDSKGKLLINTVRKSSFPYPSFTHTHAL
jgi:hypothetical protein